jgi:hypothetical protein
MPGLCRAHGCDSPTTSHYSVYCSRHQSRLRRQGDVAQDAISKAELKTYLKRVRQRIAKNPDSPAWGQLEARWLAVVEHAKGIVAGFQSGKAGIRYVRKAAEEVIVVAKAATPRDVIETVLAMRGARGQPTGETQIVEELYEELDAARDSVCWRTICSTAT